MTLNTYSSGQLDSFSNNPFEEKENWKQFLTNVIQVRDAHLNLYENQNDKKMLSRNLRNLEERYEVSPESIPLHIIAGGESLEKNLVVSQIMRMSQEDEKMKKSEWILVNTDALKVRK